ncbi:phage tail protein [Budviciaceae bacterium BWR-B9]|uniref:Phage tail protein n=1 Tax=Limnobaculum allomyrinae TaxID=2791986 RepID=A0ABS1IW02_9GAMM|nr:MULTISPECIES: phage tail protein [Limnobaculum]MBK5145934.1 phage tail protein [Limnobaculum allomyrinae]MBV7694011.1 phage tail protein [Limnobaculum sp. M2-1]
MKTWAILGNFSFDIVSSPHSYGQRSATSWAEHSLIQGKPKLEFMGDELDEITLEVLFHNHLVKTETQLRLLREAKARHEPMALVMGDGEYKGPHVITNLDTNINTTTAGGRTRSATVTLTLKEYTGEFTRPVSGEGLLDSLLTYVDAKTGTNLKNMAQQAVGYAKTAMNVINAGIDAYHEIKENPLSVLGAVAELSSIAGQAIGPLEQLSSLSGVLMEGQELIDAGSQALNEVRQAVDYLKDNSLGSVMERVDAAAGCMGNASEALNSASQNALMLSVGVATRRILS